MIKRNKQITVSGEVHGVRDGPNGNHAGYW